MNLEAGVKPSVAVIVPFHNHVEVTLACLKSIFAHRGVFPFEVIAADDCSTDPRAPEVASFPDIIYRRNPENLGFLRTCNRAAAEVTKAKYLCFLNNDTEVRPNWLDSMVELAESDSAVALVGSKLVYPDGSLQEAGGILWSDGGGHNFGRNGNPNHPEFCFVRPVDYCSGASILVRNDLFRELGGFDERYSPAYCEDSDLCMALRSKGYKVVFQPKSEVVHHEGVSSGTDLTQGVKKYQVVNSEQLFQKWKTDFSLHCPNNEELRYLAATRLCGRPRIVILSPAVSDLFNSRLWEQMECARQLGCFLCWAPYEENPSPEVVEHLRSVGVEVLKKPDRLAKDPALCERLKYADAVLPLGDEAEQACKDFTRDFPSLATVTMDEITDPAKLQKTFGTLAVPQPLSAFQTDSRQVQEVDRAAAAPAREKGRIRFRNPGTSPLFSIVLHLQDSDAKLFQWLEHIEPDLKLLDCEIFVIDDACELPLAPVLRFVDHVRVFRSEKHTGLSSALNAVLPHVRGKYVACMNLDGVPVRGWFSRVLETFETSQAGLVASKVVDPEAKIHATEWACHQRRVDPVGMGKGADDQSEAFRRSIQFPDPAAFAVSTDILKGINGLDCRFRCSDFSVFDLACAVRIQDREVLYQPEAMYLLGKTHPHTDKSGAREISLGLLLHKWDAQPNVVSPLKGPHVLVIDEVMPEHDRHAGALTIFQFIKTILAMGARVTFFPGNRYINQPYLRELQQLGVQVPDASFNISSWLLQEGADLHAALLCRPEVAVEFLKPIKAVSKAKVVYYTVDLYTLRLQRQHELTKSDFSLSESQRYRTIEKDIFDAADFSITPSPVEVDIIKEEFGCNKIELVQPWVYEDIPGLNCRPPFGGRKDIVFIGNYDHSPNVDAALWFLNEVWPLCETKLEGVRVIFAGPHAPAELRQRDGGSVCVPGHVPDLAAFLNSARISISPLRYGAGIKGKVISSLAHGLPVVSTSVGAEGLQLGNQAALLVADDAENFARQITGLYNDEQVWEQMSKNGLCFVQEFFSVQSAVESFSRFLDIPVPEESSWARTDPLPHQPDGARLSVEFAEREREVARLQLIAVAESSAAYANRRARVRIVHKRATRPSLKAFVKRVADLHPARARRKALAAAEIERLVDSGLFNADYYYFEYADVAEAGIDALQHFLREGWKEGRNPSALFDTKYYLETYPDVLEAGLNPVFHYIEHGKAEGRRPRP